MISDLKSPFGGKKSLVILIGIGILIGISLIFRLTNEAEADLVEINFEEPPEELEGGLILLQENSLLPISNPSNPRNQVIERMVVVTGYSSTIDQTDSDPFVTAAGTIVREGVVAANGLSFGTRIKLPTLYGDKIFVVEDRLPWRKGHYHIDIWFPSRDEALQFGAKITDVLILLN